MIREIETTVGRSIAYGLAAARRGEGARRWQALTYAQMAMQARAEGQSDEAVLALCKQANETAAEVLMQ